MVKIILPGCCPFGLLILMKNVSELIYFRGKILLSPLGSIWLGELKSERIENGERMEK